MGAYSNHFGMRVLESFWYAGVRVTLAVCGCILESFWYAGARVTFVCGCSNHFGMRVLELLWYAGARDILMNAYSNHFVVR